jgi:hypothetical protein
MRPKRHLAVLLIVGCGGTGGGPKPKPDDSFTFDHENGVSWIDSGQLQGTQSLLFPSTLPDGISDKIAECTFFTPELIKKTEDALASAQNDLVTGRPTSPGTEWVTISQNAYFKVNILTSNKEQDAYLKVSKIPATKLEAQQSSKNVSIDIGAARITGSLTLRSDARKCLARSICNKTNKEGGEFVSALYYGASFRFGLVDSSFSVKGKGENSLVGVDVGFKLKKDNLKLSGEIRGALTDPTISTEKLLSLLAERNLFGIDKWLQSANRFEAVAFSTVNVTKEQCEALAKAPASAEHKP